MSSLRTQEQEDVVIVSFTDTKILDDVRIQQIGKDLVEKAMQVKDGGQKMVLDFEGVGFMSSAMIGKLVLLNKKCKQEDVKLKLCNISPNVAEVFKIMRLNKVFDIFKDQEKAIKSFDKKSWFGS